MTKTTQVVQVSLGRVYSEITKDRVGTCKEAKDGTYLWELAEWNGELISSRLIPIAIDDSRKAKALLDLERTA